MTGRPRPLDELVGPGWADVLAPVADRVAALGERLRAEQAAGRRFAPAGEWVFAALAMPIDAVRIVIVGQDPYPNPSTPSGCRSPSNGACGPSHRAF